MPEPTATAATAATATSCPRCRASLTVLRARQWCPQCEWNLDEYDPDRPARAFSWTWLDRWTHRLAYRMNARQFSALAGRDLATPGASPARIAIVAISVGLLAAVLAMFVGGILLIVTTFPSLALVPGALLVLVAIALRPRFGRIDPLLDRVTPDQAPALFRLIDQVAAAVGAPAPHVVGVTREVNASAGAVGLRRRRVMMLGLPLWAALSSQQRVALLAHELGHFANGDLRRGPLTQPALTTVGMAAALTRPFARDLAPSNGLLYQLGGYLAYLIMAVFSSGLWAIHLLLTWIGLRDVQRAEYLADDRAAAAAGSAAACELLDSLVIADVIAGRVARAARETGDVAAWRAAADAGRERLADELPARRQLSLSEDASPFASHPPSGMRRRMIEARPWRDATVVLTEAESARIDVELAKLFSRARKTIGALA